MLCAVCTLLCCRVLSAVAVAVVGGGGGVLVLVLLLLLFAASSFVLHPSSVQLSISFDSASAKRDPLRPKLSVQAAISSVCTQLHRHQFLSLVTLVHSLVKPPRLPPRRGRPEKTVGEDCRAWWRYGCERVLEELRDRRRRRSAGYLLERRKARLRYASLYVKWRAGTLEALSKKERGELEELEEQFALHDLIFFRCSALKRLQACCV